ncbi:MAG TPA: metallophosphoesterase, partial [Thermodesulfovibrionia bacterium]|nr:metallophosphoesterase [Thermodesulfovibrionia bacterium]
MKPVLILHLSDLHFGKHSRFADSNPAELGKLFAQAVKEESNRRKFPAINLVIATGDIAEAARPPEYNQALTFFNTLAQELKISPINFVFAPGNHDVSWTKCTDSENELYNELIDEKEFLRRIEIDKFYFFEKFLKDFYQKETRSRAQPLKEAQAFVYDFNDLNISVGVLNSCEQVTNKKHEGQLSRKQAQALMDYWQKNKIAGLLNIVAVHHNPVATTQANIEDWRRFACEKGGIDKKDVDRFIYDIVGFNGSETLKHIAEDCQVSLILHGHQHEREQSLWEWKHGKGMCRILSAGSWGLSPQKMPQDEPNSAQLVLLDPGKSEVSVCTLKYEPKARAEGHVAKGHFVSLDTIECDKRPLSLPDGFHSVSSNKPTCDYTEFLYEYRKRLANFR